VVTIEDVLEEIVGEIEDESDKEQAEAIRVVDARTSEVQGTAPIDLVNDRLGLQLHEPEECDTIAGLLIRQLGHIPQPGESVSIDGANITVLDASRRRVERLRIELATERFD
jgi:CBS domain containing-hemolysin-like protein